MIYIFFNYFISFFKLLNPKYYKLNSSWGGGVQTKNNSRIVVLYYLVVEAALSGEQGTTGSVAPNFELQLAEVITMGTELLQEGKPRLCLLAILVLILASPTGKPKWCL